MYYTCRKNKKRLKKAKQLYLKIWLTRAFFKYCNEYYTLRICTSCPYVYSRNKLKEFIKKIYYVKI